jgi:DNA replication protein DnaC
MDSANFLPNGLIARFMNLPQSLEDAMVECEACGETVFPKRLQMNGEVRYGKGRCACQEEAAKKAMIEQQRAQMIDVQSRHIYTWLGGTFTDASLRNKTFENFDQSRQPLAYEAARAFAADPYGVLILHGSYGTGKTHLLAAICNAALRNPNPTTSLFTTSANLFNAIQKRIRDNEEIQGIIHRAVTSRLFVLDDTDKAKWTEFREEIYFAIVDERTKRELPIALSTNKLDELHTYVGGAVASRLQIGRIEVEMAGKDYRKEL